MIGKLKVLPGDVWYHPNGVYKTLPMEKVEKNLP